MDQTILNKLYQDMFLIRKTEEKLLDLFGKGELFGTIHTSLGQEAIAVGILNNIDIKKDKIFSNHRCHGHYLTIFKEPKELISEIMGKKSGICKGLGGSQHIQKENFFTNGIQGGMLPIAAGASFAEKTKNTDSIVVSFIGDGTLGEGIVYETLNLISLLKLPILVVIENNQYAQSTSIKLNLAGTIKARVDSFNIQSKEITTNNVLEIYELSREIISNIRLNRKPFVLIINTYRLGPHSKGDDNRSFEEIEFHKRQDPLVLIKDQIDLNLRREIEDKITEKIDRDISLSRGAEIVSKEEFLLEINRNK